MELQLNSGRVFETLHSFTLCWRSFMFGVVYVLGAAGLPSLLEKGFPI